MKRRRVLAAATTILGSGCLSLGAADAPPSGRTLADVTASVPDSTDFSISSSISRATITPEQTAQFDLTVTWNGEGTVNGKRFPFISVARSAEPEGLLLIPPASGTEKRGDHAWIPDEVYYPPGDMRYYELAPGDSKTHSWNVWGDPDHVSYVEPGTYSFDGVIALHPSGEEITVTVTATIATGSSSD